MGQVVMATDHGGRRTMPTGDVGSPISGRPSGTREEAATGACTVHPLHRAPPGVGEASEGRTNGIWRVEDEEAVGYVEMNTKSKKRCVLLNKLSNTRNLR